MNELLIDKSQKILHTKTCIDLYTCINESPQSLSLYLFRLEHFTSMMNLHSCSRICNSQRRATLIKNHIERLEEDVTKDLEA